VPASLGAERLDDRFLGGKTRRESRRDRIALRRQAIRRLIRSEGTPDIAIAELPQRVGYFTDTHQVDAYLKHAPQLLHT